MKTPLVYGSLSAIAGAIIILALFFLGYHSEVEKLGAAKWIGGIAGLAVGISCLVLGVKARREEIPEAEGFSFGRAMGTGVLISVVSSFLSSVFYFVYLKVINPGFTDLMIQDTLDKMQAKGMSSDQLAGAEKGMHFFMAPALQSVMNLFGGVIFGVVLSLIVAAFLKRPAPAAQPPRV